MHFAHDWCPEDGGTSRGLGELGSKRMVRVTMREGTGVPCQNLMFRDMSQGGKVTFLHSWCRCSHLCLHFTAARNGYCQ
jgi:hypothetical protein